MRSALFGYTQMISWLYDTKFPNLIPGSSATTPFISAGYWRGSGPVYFFLGASCTAGAFTTWLVVSNGIMTWRRNRLSRGAISGGVLPHCPPMRSARCGRAKSSAGRDSGGNRLSLASHPACGAQADFDLFPWRRVPGFPFTGAMQNASSITRARVLHSMPGR